MKRLVVVSAGTSPTSVVTCLARWTGAAVAGRARASGVAMATHDLDLDGYAAAVGEGLLTCLPAAGLAPAIEQIGSADALVVATPVHNAAYSALFKGFFDQMPRDALAGVPTLMAIVGGSERHDLVLDHVLRPYLSTLRCLVVPTAVGMHRGDWLPHGVPSAALDERIRRGAGEVVALLDASRHLRRHVQTDPALDI